MKRNLGADNGISGDEGRRMAADRSKRPFLVSTSRSSGTWVKAPVILDAAVDVPSTDFGLVIESNSLVDPNNPTLVRPSKTIGEGIANQLLADAPYFYTDPLAPKDVPRSVPQNSHREQSEITPFYNLTHYYSPAQIANKYLVNSVIRPLLDPRCTFHERFALEVYRQDACRKVVDAIRLLGYSLPHDPKRPVIDQCAVIASLRGLLLKSVVSSTDPLIKDYNAIRDFGTGKLRVPGVCYFRMRDRKGKLKPEDLQQKFIEWISIQIIRLKRAEEQYASLLSQGVVGSRLINAHIDIVNARAFGLPQWEIVKDEEEEEMGDEEDDNIVSPLLKTTSEDESEDTSKEIDFANYKHNLRNAVGFFVHYSPAAGKGNPTGYRDVVEGCVHNSLVAKGDLPTVAMKGWFDLKDVLGPRNDRRARRDEMRRRGELPPIYDPETRQNVEDDRGVSEASSSVEPVREETQGEAESSGLVLSSVIATPSAINVHKKMMYFQTTTIDPTLAVTVPLSLPGKVAKVNQLDFTCPASAADHLRRLRSSEASLNSFHSKLEAFSTLEEVKQFQMFANKLRDEGVDELKARIKQFDVRLGTVHAKEGAANEERVWRDNIPRIIRQVLMPRYGAVLRAALGERNETDLGKDHFFSDASANDTDLADILLSFYRTILSSENSVVCFWTIKCQLMLLTEAEMAAVEADARYQRVRSFFDKATDAFVCQHYKLGNAIVLEDIAKRENLQDIESELMKTGNIGDADNQVRGKNERQTASGIRSNILKYWAFWIFCSQFNAHLESKGNRPIPFFHFVTVNTRYATFVSPTEKWAHVGEFDGLLLDIGSRTPQLLNVFEIKANSADLTSAWKQRERFLLTLWSSLTRPSGHSFVPPKHLNWYTAHGDQAPSVIADNEVGLSFNARDKHSSFNSCAPGELGIYPMIGGGNCLPPFYQFIFPLLSFNLSNLLESNGIVNDFGQQVQPASTLVESLRQYLLADRVVGKPLPAFPMRKEMYSRMLGVWVFISFVIVTREGVPIVPEWRLPGMGSFRHTLCNGAAVAYAEGRRQYGLTETWEDAKKPHGTVGKLWAAQERHTGSSTKVVGPWLQELEEASPVSLLATRFSLPAHSTIVFNNVFYSAVKYQTSKITKTILCPQELISELSRNGYLSSMLLIPKFEAEQLFSPAK